ncbi:MAG: shikimate kinase [Rikenellaceae bacterium]|nr:shikimate kinase [Rikenellaceae bacterium]
MKVFLIGFMGCGKTSLGKKIASKVGWPFTDMDREIEERCGMKVSQVFERFGERHFRSLEREILIDICRREGDAVVSTGGGAPCHGDNMELMNSAGKTVYLRMSPGKLVSRLEHGRDKRPKIKGMDDGELLSFIREILPGREEAYCRAHLVIDCDGASDDYICSHIADFLEPGAK